MGGGNSAARVVAHAKGGNLNPSIRKGKRQRSTRSVGGGVSEAEELLEPPGLYLVARPDHMLDNLAILADRLELPVRHVESAAMRFRQLDGKAKGELRVTDIQRYADATHQKLNSSRTMDARYTHHARLMRPVFEHMILPHAARRVAASSRRNHSELSETAVTQEDFVTGLVAFMGNRPSAEERIRAVFRVLSEGKSELHAGQVKKGWSMMAKQQPIVGGGSVSVEKLNPGQPNQREFLTLFKKSPKHTISEDEFVEHVMASFKRLPKKTQEAALGIDWWPQRQSEAEHGSGPDDLDAAAAEEEEDAP